VQPQLTALGDEFDAPVSNKTMLGWLLAALNGMKQNTSIAVNRSFEIRKPLNGISLAGAIGMGEKIEQLRWPITMAVLSALLVLCVVLVVGVARHSRCVLITYVPLMIEMGIEIFRRCSSHNILYLCLRLFHTLE